MEFEFEELEAQKENLATRQSLINRQQDSVESTKDKERALSALTTTASKADGSNEVLLDSVYEHLRKKEVYTRKDYDLIQSVLSTLKEHATDQLKNDPKYFFLWKLVLKRNQRDPGDLFKYLFKNSIGFGLAEFYLDYCAFLESFGRINEADKMYRIGIARKAHPIKTLVSKYSDFIIRKQDLKDETEESEVPDKAIPLATRKGPLPQAGSNTKKFKVLHEKEKPEKDDTLDIKKNDDRFEDLNFITAQKENEPAVETMAGTTFQQKSLPKVEKLQVFVDDDTKSTKQPPVQDNQVLMYDYEHLMGKDGEISFEEYRAQIKADNSHSSNWHFDESIAIDMRSSVNTKPPLSIQSDRHKTTLDSIEDTPVAIKEKKEKKDDYKSTIGHEDIFERKDNEDEDELLDDKENPLFAFLDTAPKSSVLLFNTSNPAAGNTNVAQPSPTVHTKGAMNDIFEMFNAPLEPAVDENVIWYNPEDDETISKQVFKRIGSGLEVFKDNDSDEEEALPETKKMFGKVHIMTPLTERSFGHETNTGTTVDSFCDPLSVLLDE